MNGLLISAIIAQSCLAASPRVFEVHMDDRTRERLSNLVSHVMSLSEEEVIALVPEQSGIYFTDCPNCDTGSQDRANWDWTPEHPGRIRCKGCGAIFPGNPKYPDDRYIAVATRHGEHRYHYYERPDGYRLFFRATADYLAAEYMAARCRDLAALYWATRDDRYARRAALILIRFAEVYPDWANKFDYPFRQKVFVPHSQRRIPGVPEYRTSCWSWWAYMGVPLYLLEAWDAVRLWPGLDALDPKARAKIENDLFADAVGFVMGFEETYSNMSPHMWRSFILAGRVLERPEWISETLKRIDRFWSTQFLYDGHWMETSPDYCTQVRGSMKTVLDALEGYSVPASAPTEMGDSISTILKKSRTSFSALERANDITKMPDGRNPPVNDTWAHPRGTPRDRSTSLLMPGLGLAILAGGEGEHQIYSWLNFTSGVQHKHNDALSIGLFAFGRELLRDIGYTHTAWRAWVTCTASHNTVLINGLDSGLDREHSGHRLRAFFSDGAAFRIAEAESGTAYPGVASLYRRTICLVGADCRDAYLIDVFHVRGGAQHDYLLHGSAAEDSIATVSGASLAPFEGSLVNAGTTFRLPRAESESVGNAGGLGFIRNLSAGRAEGAVTLDLKFRQSPDIGTRSTLICPPETTIYLGEGPRVRQAEGNDSLLPNFWAPAFCARRRGNNLDSVFVAVHEPVRGEPRTRRVSARVESGALLVAIDRGESGRDYFAMGLDGPVSASIATADGNLYFEGGYGLVRIAHSRVTSMHLYDGAALRLGHVETKSMRGWDGRIVAVGREEGTDVRGWFDVTDRIPPDAVVGALLLRFADGTVRGYNVRRTEPLATGTRIHVVEDPGFDVGAGNVVLTSYPQRRLKGTEVMYHLGCASAAIAAQEPSPASGGRAR